MGIIDEKSYAFVPARNGSAGWKNLSLFATEGIEDPSPSAPRQISSSHEGRHVLPKDLPNAVKHLNDEELDRLLVVTLAEAKRRGRQTTPANKPSPSPNDISRVFDARATKRRSCGF